MEKKLTLDNYLTENEYEVIKGINLNLELVGSTDHDENAAKVLIFKVEQDIINYLTTNYDFKEEMICTNNHTMRMFKLAVCDQVEYTLTNGMSTAKEEITSKSFLCDSAKAFLRRAGFMNYRGF